MYIITDNTIQLWIQEFAGGPPAIVECVCVWQGGGGGVLEVELCNFWVVGVENCNLLFILSKMLYSPHKGKMVRL